MTDIIKLKKISQDEQIVYGEVFAPFMVDAHGDFFSDEEIVKMKNMYDALAKSEKIIDVMHDGKAIEAYPIESFIAKAGNPDYAEGAWVLGVKIEDAKVWELVKSGKINGYSIGALGRKVPMEQTYRVYPEVVGETMISEDHTHAYIVKVDDSGKVISGVTSVEKGHSHTISYSMVTDRVNNHSHRFETN